MKGPWYLILCLMFFAVGCGHSGDDPDSRDARRQEQEVRQEILDETRGGGFQDPGGAREMRDEEHQRQDQLQDAMREIDRQSGGAGNEPE